MAEKAFEIRGVKQLRSALMSLKKRISNQIVKAALNPLSAEMVARAKANAPVGKTGRLRNAIKTRNRFVRRGAVYAADALVDAGSSRTDSNGAFYAHFVEFGHKTRSAGIIFGSSGFVAPRPFWSPAFNSTYGPGGMVGILQAQNAIANGILAHLARTVPKL